MGKITVWIANVFRDEIADLNSQIVRLEDEVTFWKETAIKQAAALEDLKAERATRRQ